MDILVRSSSELRGAFASANDGDVIRLAPGDYGSTLLRGRDFGTDVTITSADPGNRAVFTEDLEFNNVSGVTVQGIDVEADSIASNGYSSRFQIVRSQDVTVRDVSVEGHIPTSGEGANPGSASRTEAISGFGYENGMRVRWSENVSLENIELSDFRQALAVIKSDNTSINGVEIHDVREGININDVENTLIENSRFYDFNPFPGDHPDMIQFWGTDSGVHGLVVRNNFLEQSEGWTQSIFGHFNGSPDNVNGSDFTITGNTIINAHPNAIRIRDVDGFEISDNLLLPNDPNYDYRRLPQIILLDSENGEVSGNLLLPRWNGALLNVRGNDADSANINAFDNVALSTNPGDPFYWAGLLDGRVPATPSAAEDEETVVEDGSSPDDLPNEDVLEADAPTEDGVSGDDVTEQVEETPAEEDGPLAEEAPENPEPETPGAPDGDQPPVAVSDADGGSEPEVEDLNTDGGEVPADDAPIDLSQVDISGTSDGDWLRDTAGSTSLAGLDGKDFFVFDYRKDTGSSRDVLVDLNFDEGDRLILVGNEQGTFDNDVDPENNLMVLYGGSRAQIRSEDDLREAAASGGISLDAGPNGDSLIVTLDEAPDRSIELLGISPDGFLA